MELLTNNIDGLDDIFIYEHHLKKGIIQKNFSKIIPPVLMMSSSRRLNYFGSKPMENTSYSTPI